MGTRYRYWTPDSSAPSNGIPPGQEGLMFGPQYSFGNTLPFGPSGFPSFCGPPPPPSPMMCLPGCTMSPSRPFFPMGGPPPPPYSPWGQPMPVAGPGVPTLTNEKPPPGARVNGEIAKFNNKQGHIHSKKNTMFHVVLDGSKPWQWPDGTSHRLQVYTVASSMPIDEFIEQIGAIEKAPGVPREQIGLQEAIEEGNGQWRAGVAFRLGDENLIYQQADGTILYQTLEQLGWSSQRGQAGRGKPVTVTFLP